MATEQSATTGEPTAPLAPVETLTLSRRLAQLIAEHHAGAPLTLNGVFAKTHGQGIYLVIILCCLPFVAPVSIPGFSNVLGPILALIGIRLALGRPPLLPRLLGDRPLPESFERVLNGSVKVLRFLERWVRPRRTIWMCWRAARFANGLLLALMAALLALPLPPLIPFTNTLPAYAILLLALSMMEDDGWLIWLAYAVAAGTVGYFVFWADMIVGLSVKYAEPLLNWLGFAS